MTFISYTLIVLGCLTLFAGSIGLLLARYRDKHRGRYLRPATVSAVAAVPLMVVGLLIGDAREVAGRGGALSAAR